MSGRTFTRSGAARVNVTATSYLFLASDIIDLTCRIVSVGLPSTAMVKSRSVDLHLGICAAGVDSMHSRSSMRSVSV